MASEVSMAKEGRVNPINAVRSANDTSSNLSRKEEKLVNDSVNRVLQSVFEGSDEAWSYAFPKAKKALSLLKKDKNKYFKKGDKDFDKAAERLLSEMGVDIVKNPPSAKADKKEWNKYRLFKILGHLSADYIFP